MSLSRKSRAVPRATRPALHLAARRRALEVPRLRSAALTRVSGFLAAALVALAATGCNPMVQGNGVLREDDRTSKLSPFLGVSAQDGILTDITVGPALRVVVSGDENVVQYVETTVQTDAALGIQVLVARVSFVNDYTTRNPLRLTVSVPELRFVRALGTTRAEAQGVGADRFRVEGGDGSTVVVAGAGVGAAPALEVALSGGQHGALLDARSYPVTTASVELTGSSRAQLQASGEVTGTAVPPSRVENSGSGLCSVQDGQGTVVSCLPGP